MDDRKEITSPSLPLSGQRKVKIKYKEGGGESKIRVVEN